jgi:hypothetical protein
MSFNLSIINFIQKSDQALFLLLKKWFRFVRIQKLKTGKDLYVEFYNNGEYQITTLSEEDIQRININKALVVKIPTLPEEIDQDRFIDLLSGEILNKMFEDIVKGYKKDRVSS